MMPLQWVEIDSKTFKLTDGIRHRFENVPRAMAWVLQYEPGKWLARFGGRVRHASTFEKAKSEALRMCCYEPPEQP
jgi:hypothetical protein